MMVALPDDTDLLRCLDEKNGLGREQQLARNAPRPTAGLGHEGAVPVAYQIVVHPHLSRRPTLEIGVFGIGQTLLRLPRIGPTKCRVGPHGSYLPRNWPEVYASVEQPAEIGGHEVWNGAFLRSGSRSDTHRDSGDQRCTVH